MSNRDEDVYYFLPQGIGDEDDDEDEDDFRPSHMSSTSSDSTPFSSAPAKTAAPSSSPSALSKYNVTSGFRQYLGMPMPVCQSSESSSAQPISSNNDSGKSGDNDNKGTRQKLKSCPHLSHHACPRVSNHGSRLRAPCRHGVRCTNPKCEYQHTAPISSGSGGSQEGSYSPFESAGPSGGPSLLGSMVTNGNESATVVSGSKKSPTSSRILGSRPDGHVPYRNMGTPKDGTSGGDTSPVMTITRTRVITVGSASGGRSSRGALYPPEPPLVGSSQQRVRRRRTNGRTTSLSRSVAPTRDVTPQHTNAFASATKEVWPTLTRLYERATQKTNTNTTFGNSARGPTPGKLSTVSQEPGPSITSGPCIATNTSLGPVCASSSSSPANSKRPRAQQKQNKGGAQAPVSKTSNAFVQVGGGSDSKKQRQRNKVRLNKSVKQVSLVQASHFSVLSDGAEEELDEDDEDDIELDESSVDTEEQESLALASGANEISGDSESFLDSDALGVTSHTMESQRQLSSCKRKERRRSKSKSQSPHHRSKSRSPASSYISEQQKLAPSVVSVINQASASELADTSNHISSLKYEERSHSPAPSDELFGAEDAPFEKNIDVQDVDEMTSEATLSEVMGPGNHVEDDYVGSTRNIAHDEEVSTACKEVLEESLFHGVTDTPDESDAGTSASSRLGHTSRRHVSDDSRKIASNIRRSKQPTNPIKSSRSYASTPNGKRTSTLKDKSSDRQSSRHFSSHTTILNASAFDEKDVSSSQLSSSVAPAPINLQLPDPDLIVSNILSAFQGAFSVGLGAVTQLRKASSVKNATNFFSAMGLGFLILVMHVCSEVVHVHREAFRTLKLDHHLAFCLIFLYAFPHLVRYMTYWAPPWAAPCLWYSFLMQVFSNQRHPRLIALSRLCLPLLFFAENVSHHVLLLELNGSERLVVASILATCRSHDFLRPSFLGTLIVTITFGLMYGELFFVQWLTLITSLHFMQHDSGRKASRITASIPSVIQHDGGGSSSIVFGRTSMPRSASTLPATILALDHLHFSVFFSHMLGDFFLSPP